MRLDAPPERVRSANTERRERAQALLRRRSLRGEQKLERSDRRLPERKRRRDGRTGRQAHDVLDADGATPVERPLRQRARRDELRVAEAGADQGHEVQPLIVLALPQQAGQCTRCLRRQPRHLFGRPRPVGARRQRVAGQAQDGCRIGPVAQRSLAPERPDRERDLGGG